ncbi:IclR family transcriptional regulator [Yinghuangia sp. ASG 101]|uniref:IclR family transcriptional regulator n=1 Tax=Yinghuangia sp. ASG 101 TaxID=2896848 RepID=UPI001E28A1B9|nr:IclR family transcriptional regulator [Yinghuangia sp. ASG 101]UGQ11415.1 IclR family transcriptional regulator [Yinghuangia sp. ASG 101]
MDDHTVAGRVFAILDTVASRATPVGLAELTRDTGIPKPTVRRIAADLVRRRLLERIGDRYRLGSHTLDLGMRAAAQRGLVRAAAPHLQELLVRTGEIAWVSTCTDDAVTQLSVVYGANRVLDAAPGSWPIILNSPVFPATAVGRLVLAERPELVEELRTRPLRPMTRYTPTSWPQLMAILGHVRDTGVAQEAEHGALGYYCIATAIRAPDGSAAGFVGVTGRTSGQPFARIARPLQAAAAEISHVLAATF